MLTIRDTALPDDPLGRGGQERAPIDLSALSIAPQGLALDAARRELYIADDVAARVFVRNADTGAAVRDYDISAFSRSPVGLTLDAARRELYITDFTPARVFVRNADTGAAVRDYDISAFSIAPQGLALDAARRELYIADTFAAALASASRGRVFVRNADTGAAVRGYDISAFSIAPQGLALDAGRRELYIADGNAARVFVRNAAALAAVRDYDISAFSRSPAGLTLDAARRELYIADSRADRVFVRNADTFAPATYPSNIILRSPRELNIGDPRPITHIQRGRFASGQPHLTPYNTPLAEITVEIPEPLAERRVSSGELRKFTDSEHPDPTLGDFLIALQQRLVNRPFSHTVTFTPDAPHWRATFPHDNIARPFIITDIPDPRNPGGNVSLGYRNRVTMQIRRPELAFGKSPATARKAESY